MLLVTCTRGMPLWLCDRLSDLGSQGHWFEPRPVVAGDLVFFYSVIQASKLTLAFEEKRIGCCKTLSGRIKVLSAVGF